MVLARPLRIRFEGAIYHVLSRGNARQLIFLTEADKENFLTLLADSGARFGVAVHSFALMGNHFHLLVQTRRANLSRWMHWLMVAYSVYFNRRHRRSGHLLQGRYKSFVVEEGQYLLELSRYIHLNPVRGGSAGARHRRRAAGAAAKVPVEQSFRGYAGLESPGFLSKTA